MFSKSILLICATVALSASSAVAGPSTSDKGTLESRHPRANVKARSEPNALAETKRSDEKRREELTRALEIISARGLDEIRAALDMPSVAKRTYDEHKCCCDGNGGGTGDPAGSATLSSEYPEGTGTDAYTSAEATATGTDTLYDTATESAYASASDTAYDPNATSAYDASSVTETTSEPLPTSTAAYDKRDYARRFLARHRRSS